jgi:hypothetical protein
MADTSFGRDEIEHALALPVLTFGDARQSAQAMAEKLAGLAPGVEFPTDEDAVDEVEDFCLMILKAVAVRRAQAAQGGPSL